MIAAGKALHEGIVHPKVRIVSSFHFILMLYSCVSKDGIYLDGLTVIGFHG